MHILRILLCPTGKRISMKLDMETQVYDLCRDLYSKISKHITGPIEDFGLFVPDNDPTRAYWLDNAKPICYYPLVDKNLILEFKSRIRRLIIRTMDDTKKTLAIDDSKTIAELILPICNKMGISNHEEYSLIREIDDEERMKTMTLKKGKNQIRDFEKMEKMKQKLKTDDELNWLPHAKTLRQLGVDEKDEVLLRRKYFFSDQNVDARDPIQLNLLYAQLRDAIIDGTHPVSIEEAVKLAGIQCQAEMGNLSNEKQKLLHSRLKEYLPKEYVKTKGIEKKIVQHYETLKEVPDKEAKVLYAQFCRSLKTYGITFFLVKEKLRAKNKLVPRLMGISKENVMRVDEKTKEIIQSWPLTTVRRYAATASLFSLDFGDYSDENYVIQTLEGEKIAQLIAGYIDIIIKKKKAKYQHDDEVDEETAMIEENVAPSKANIISHSEVEPNRHGFTQHSVASVGQLTNTNSLSESGQISQGRVSLPSQQTIGVKNEGRIGQGRFHVPTQKFQIRDLSQPKRALAVRIGENLKLLQSATETLDEENMQVAKLGNDESSRKYRIDTLNIAKNKIKSNMMPMTMATGNLLSMLQFENENEEGEDYNRIDTAVTTIGFNTVRLLDNVRKVYEVTADSEDFSSLGPDLLGATKNLLTAFQDLLNASKPYKHESDEELAREIQDDEFKLFSDKSLLDAVNKVGEASRSLLKYVMVNKALEDEELLRRDLLLSDAKQVASLVSALVKLIKEASISMTEIEGPAMQSNLIQSVKVLGQATSMLVSAAKVAACSAEQLLSQQQICSAGVHVINFLQDVLDVAQPIQKYNPELYSDMENYASEIHYGIDRLKQHVVGNSIAAYQDETVTKFLTASERLPNVIGNQSEMLEQVKILTETGTELVYCLDQSQQEINSSLTNHSSGQPDGSMASMDSLDGKQKRLVIASQALADAVEKLVHATKACHVSNNPDAQTALAQSAQHMISVAHLTAGEIIRQRVSKGLEFAGRHTAISADQLVSSSQEAVKHTAETNAVQLQRAHLSSEIGRMTDVVLPDVVSACGVVRNNPGDGKAQTDLLNSCQGLIRSLDTLLQCSDALSPQVQDPSYQNALNISVQTSGCTLAELKETVARAETVLRPTKAASIAQLEEDGQLQILHSLLDTAAEAVAKGELYPLPGETVESISSIIGNCGRSANKALSKLYEDLADLQMKLGDAESDTSLLQGDLLAGARSLMESMEKMLKGVRGLAAVTPNTESADESLYNKQIALLDTGKQIIRDGSDVIQALKFGSVGAVDLEDVKKSIDQMHQDIDQLMVKLPTSKKIDDLVSKLTASMSQFDQDCTKKASERRQSPSNGSGTTNKSSNQLQSEFTTAVAIFNQTLNELVNNNTGNFSALTNLTSQLEESHRHMLSTGSALLASQGHQPDESSQTNELARALHDVSDETSQLLMDQLKAVLNNCGVYGDNSDANLMKQSLVKAAGQVSDSINKLLSSCASTLPRTQQVCESTQREVEGLKTSLLSEPPTLSINNDSYSECIGKVDNNAQLLLSSIRDIPASCKNQNEDTFCSSIRQLADATNCMLTAATQANYRIGLVQSSNSSAATSTSNTANSGEKEKNADSTGAKDSASTLDGLRDDIMNHSRQIKENCADLTSDEISEMKCRELANDTKKRAGNVCQLLKEIIQRTDDKTKQTKLLEAGKVVAESTTNLIRTISSNPRSLARDSWNEASDRVAQSVLDLVTAIDAPIESEPQQQPAQTVTTNINEQGRSAQQHIHKASLDVVEGSTSLLRAASALSKDPTSIPANQAYIINQRTCNDAIKKLQDTVKYCSPGQQELLEVQEDVKHNLRTLSRANSGFNPHKSSASLAAELQRVRSSLRQVHTNVGSVDNLLRTRGNLEYLGKNVAQAGSYLAPLTEAVNNLSVSLPHNKDRAEVVELTRTVLEGFLVSVESCRGIQVNSNTKAVKEDIGSLKEGITDLTKFIDRIISAQDTVEGYISSLQKSMAKLSTGEGVDYSSIVSAQANGGDIAAIGHTKIMQCVKSMVGVLGEISMPAQQGSKLRKRDSVLIKKQPQSKDGTEQQEEIEASQGPAIMSSSSQYGGVEKKLVQDYEWLVMGILQVVYGRTHEDNGDQLKKIGLSIGQSSLDLIRYDQIELTNHIRQRISDLTLALQSSAKATQAYIQAVSEISQITNDLDTAILFANSGSLNLSAVESNLSVTNGSSNAALSMVEMKDEVAKSYRLIRGDLQKILSESQVNDPTIKDKPVHQDKLVSAIGTCVGHLRDLSGKSRLGAISLQDSDKGLDIDCNIEFGGHQSQTLLLNAVRDVNVAVVDFLNCLKNRAGTAGDQQSHILESKDAALNKMEGLVKTIKSLEDTENKGTRALETALEAMQKELGILEAWSPEQNYLTEGDDTIGDGVTRSSFNDEHDVGYIEDESLYTADNLVLMTKSLITASQKAMEAVQTFKQDDILIAANFGRKSVQDFARHLRKTVARQTTLETQQKDRSRILLDSNTAGSGHPSAEKPSQKMVENGKGAVKSLIELYEQLDKAVADSHPGRGGPGGGKKQPAAGPYKMQATLASRRVTHAIHEVAECAKTFIPEPNLTTNTDEDNSAELSQEMAKGELEEAAKQIEAVVQKLSLFKMKKPSTSESSKSAASSSGESQPQPVSDDSQQQPDEEEEWFVECRGVVEATQDLLLAASQAQRELEGAHGFVGAARMVVAATETLCVTVKAIMTSRHKQECGPYTLATPHQSSLISASKQIAAGTTRLLLAGQVRAAGNQSRAWNNLQGAGARVRKSTDALVKRVDAMAHVSETTTTKVEGPSASIVSSMRNVIQVQAELVAKEKELEMLRNKYKTIRQEHVTTHPEYFEDS